MSKDKQIEEMAKIICGVTSGCEHCMFNYNTCFERKDAEEIYNAGYRKIYDDHQRQCTCYALGCQMAEELEKKVAREFIEAVDSMMECVTAMTGLSLTYYGKYAELKKKYTEEEK